MTFSIVHADSITAYFLTRMPSENDLTFRNANSPPVQVFFCFPPQYAIALQGKGWKKASTSVSLLEVLDIEDSSRMQHELSIFSNPSSLFPPPSYSSCRRLIPGLLHKLAAMADLNQRPLSARCPPTKSPKLRRGARGVPFDSVNVSVERVMERP
jgi:hypothetical protein